MADITFILPTERNFPIGGYKVVYEYANRLCERGWKVRIGYDCRQIGRKYDMPSAVRRVISKCIGEYRRWFYPRWFSLSPFVGKFCIYKDDVEVSAANLVATACTTTDLVNRNTVGEKIYFIQGYEVWGGISEQAVKATYCYDMKKIVIAKWLKNIVDNTCGNEKSILLRNGIDRQEFYLEKPTNKRKRIICMLYHKNKLKGSAYGIETLVKLKIKYPDLQAVLFGVPPRPNKLPAWIDYVQNASIKQLRKIYNEAQIYLYPAIEDGFGLTCVESMACGCALCASDYYGVHEFAVNGENALLSPIKDSEAMVKNVCRLFDDESLRYQIAAKGYDSISMFDWEISVRKFEELLQKS